ncbi:MAG: DUF885 domain-containing protein [Actinomycetales bacterium]|nr:MAG: DUF885 domain-containing protein [Actinomycetales bacterium]
MTDRVRTDIDVIADNYVDTIAQLSPISATDMGIAGHDHRLDDFSPAGHQARQQAASEVLAKLETAQISDDIDRVTVAAMKERLGLQLELFEAGEHLRDLNCIASPPQIIRQIFDLMPNGSVQDWEVIANRLAEIPKSLAGYTQTLKLGHEKSMLPAKRQLELVIAESQENAGEDSFFTALITKSPQLPAGLTQQLQKAADGAREAYGELANELKQLIGDAPEKDAVGKERYKLLSRVFIGAKIDFDETYEWGLKELINIIAEQRKIAEQLEVGSIEEAFTKLDADPRYKLHGTDALQAWMQQTSDEAIAALADKHFDIPDPLHKLECRIAPTNSGAIYYTGPSEDFSRPGRMWWSVPEGVVDFTTWMEKTTVYHEGVPGHHLQIAQTMYRKNLLNRWRRMACWVSGHGEGWALYAERLMSDLGFLDDPGDRMGMLDSQRLRAARVVLDIGVHLEKPHPDGGIWNAENAWEFLRSNVNMNPEFLRFELNRYLGWAGQAPSYKIGQRLWEQIRDEALRNGEELKSFHRRALDVGSLGLDTLRAALRQS